MTIRTKATGNRGPGLCLVIPHSPDQVGTVADLWPRGDYPPAVAEVVRRKVWCDAAGDYVPMSDPLRLTVQPPPGVLR